MWCHSRVIKQLLYRTPDIVCPNNFVIFWCINSKREVPLIYRYIQRPSLSIMHWPCTSVFWNKKPQKGPGGSKYPPRRIAFCTQSDFFHPYHWIAENVYSYIYCHKKIKYSLYPAVQHVGQECRYFHAKSNVRKVVSHSNAPTATLFLHEFLHSLWISCIHYKELRQKNLKINYFKVVVHK